MNTYWHTLDSFSFGDSPEMADKLLESVLNGSKRATSWAIADGNKSELGEQMVVLDGNAMPRAIIETVEIVQRRFCDVDLAFALDEGEDIQSLEDWRECHKAFFEKNGRFDFEMMLWCERFKLIEIIEI